MPNQRTVVNGDAALVLKLATHIDEHILADDGVLSAVGMERWEQAYRFRHFPSEQLL